MIALRTHRLTRRTMLLHAGLCLAGATTACADEALFDAEGYRCARYRSVVDRLPDPARRIALAEALMLGSQGLFIDVLPAEGALRDAHSGQWRLAEAHQSIPGALWFPETGRAPVDPALWQPLLRHTARWRQDHPAWPIAVFCRADCWMSWNAARRLARAGLPGVFWLAEGIDGWHDAGRALDELVPEAA